MFIIMRARKYSLLEEEGGMANLYGALPSIMVVSARRQTLKSSVVSTMSRPALEERTTTSLSERTSISMSLWAACSGGP